MIVFISVEKDGDPISNKKDLVELFNQNYINIVENSSAKTPSSLADCLDASQNELTLKEIISVYSDYRSIQKIKRVFNTDSKFDLSKPTASDIKKIIKFLDTNKATGPDGILAKLVQMSANVIGCYLSNIVTCHISETKYFDHAKIAAVKMLGQKLKTTGL